MKRTSDIRGVVKRQKMYSKMARREGQEALKKKKKEEDKGAHEMAEDSEREAAVAFGFAKLRKKIAKIHQAKLVQEYIKNKKERKNVRKPNRRKKTTS